MSYAMNNTRAALLERWHSLTRVVLPGMAATHYWPIRLDHCFMRVCLDHACGGQWTEHIARPAIHHADFHTLSRAVMVAERIQRDPALLPALNRQSLLWRGKLR